MYTQRSQTSGKCQNIVSFIGLFCKRDLQFKEPTNRSHHIVYTYTHKDVHSVYTEKQKCACIAHLYIGLLIYLCIHILICFPRARDTGWRRSIGCLICIGHFLQKSPIICGSFAEDHLQLNVSYGSSPPCISSTHTHTIIHTRAHTHARTHE